MFKTIVAACVTATIVFVGSRGWTGAAGGAAKSDECREAMAATCNKMYTCKGQIPLEQIKKQFGPTEADCTEKLSVQCQWVQCPPGMSYDKKLLAQCARETRAQTCEQAAKDAPASCKTNRCK